MQKMQRALLTTVAAVIGSVLATSGGASGSRLQPTVVSEVAASYTPHVASDAFVAKPLALAVRRVHHTIYVGGRFHSVENADRTVTYIRNDLVAFNETTGEVSPTFVPVFDGPVFALLGAGDSVYVGGQFSTVNGISRPGIVKLDAVTGAVDRAFQPDVIRGGRVSEIRLIDGRLLVAGNFPRQLVALNPATGADTHYISLPISGKLPLSTAKTEVYRFAVNPDRTRLVGVGNFTTVDGRDRKRAFMLDLGASSVSVDPWYYPPLENKCMSDRSSKQAYLEDVDFSPEGDYFVFAATGFVPETQAEIGTAVCDAAARFDTADPSPTRPVWINYTGGDTLHAVAVTGAAVYVQGHNRWLDNPSGQNSKGPGAVDRHGIGAIDPASGMALPWQVYKPAEQGGQDFLVTKLGLWVVSDSHRWGRDYHNGIAFAPLP